MGSWDLNARIFYEELGHAASLLGTISAVSDAKDFYEVFTISVHTALNSDFCFTIVRIYLFMCILWIYRYIASEL